VEHVYFDHNATAPVHPEVLTFYAEALSMRYGNASSIHHFGQAAKRALETARRQIAESIGCGPREIVFNSGGTESDNLAIFGVARLHPGCHIVTSAIEHPAVLNACARLETEGFPVTYVRPDGEGIVSPLQIHAALRPDTALVSVMHANNETGVIQPIAEIADAAHEAGALFHTDAVQTAGRLPVKVNDLRADLLSIGGHKFGAPKGVGALYVRKDVSISPLFYGGHHERDRRAGTENVPGAMALGKAASLANDWSGLAALRDRLERGILQRVPCSSVNGAVDSRLPNTSNIRFRGVEGEAMTIALDLRGYAVSSGSACSSGAVEPSHVLLAMGLSPEDARSSVRFSLGPSNTRDEVEGLIEAVVQSVEHLRRISPDFDSAENERTPAHV